MFVFGYKGLPRAAYKVGETTKICPHCRSKSGTGTHGGCYNCRKVKHTYNGKREDMYSKYALEVV